MFIDASVYLQFFFLINIHGGGLDLENSFQSKPFHNSYYHCFAKDIFPHSPSHVSLSTVYAVWYQKLSGGRIIFKVICPEMIPCASSSCQQDLGGLGERSELCLLDFSRYFEVFWVRI